MVVVNKSTVPIGSGNWVEATIREHYQELMAQNRTACSMSFPALNSWLRVQRFTDRSIRTGLWSDRSMSPALND